jgi:predicted CopG family antitoxin
MKKQTITIDREVGNKLHELKRELRHRNMSEVINYLFYELEKTKGELEGGECKPSDASNSK